MTRTISFSPPGDVRTLAIRGAGMTLFSNGLALVVQTASTVILARLLTPTDFGLVTLVTTFSLLVVNFGINGFTEAVIQSKEVDHALASNLFWINLAAGTLLTAAFAASGKLLARFFHEPLVASITVGISLSIFLTSISVLHLALLKRAMRFSETATNDIIARAISLATAILLAWRGWGAWALVAGIVTQPLCSSIGAWFLCPWIPQLPARVPGTAALVGFALNVYGRFSVNYFSRNSDNLLVGWRFKAQALGFYKKAYDLFALSSAQLVAPLSNVVVSALSRLIDDFPEYKRQLLNTLSVMAFVGMGLGAMLTLVGKDVIRLLLGPGWEESGRIFTFFGPGVGVMLLYATHGWIHLSIGRADRWFRWGILEFAFTFLLFILGLRWGPPGIAVAWTASFWILVIPAFWYAGKPIRLGVAPVFAAVWKHILSALLAAFTCATVVQRLPALITLSGSVGAFTRILITSIVFGAFYLSAVILLYGGCAPLHQVVRLFGEMIPWKRLSTTSATFAMTPGSGSNEAFS